MLHVSTLSLGHLLAYAIQASLTEVLHTPEDDPVKGLKHVQFNHANKNDCWHNSVYFVLLLVKSCCVDWPWYTIGFNKLLQYLASVMKFFNFCAKFGDSVQSNKAPAILLWRSPMDTNLFSLRLSHTDFLKDYVAKANSDIKSWLKYTNKIKI
jgi:hypothetical protein